VINVLIVIVYVMSLVKRDEVKYRSILSYIADVSFGFGCVFFLLYIILMLFGGAAVDSAAQMGIDTTCDFYGRDST
jgi:hypothetical protein